MPTKGVINVTVQVNGQTAKLPLYVVEGNFSSLLGRSWLEELILDWPALGRLSKEDSRLTTMLNKHSEVFKEELGNMKDMEALALQNATLLSLTFELLWEIHTELVYDA